ncbi:DeoR family transcriptional regulator [Paenibacillus sp. J31TS4]|uniref:helix-turn-helix transcriptional regulator n=1 Tax=Paenibacillus sp. J31TS4 TaxID=2807195 RepID=UPI001B1E90A4|nr:YafY family protein [Paenibacillus sp. J31TS4]GIP41244.1 DeoR family transcriptional regulator [Paenibacillus sp. J31TS4]
MKIDRLLAITMLLLNRRRVSAKELADRFEVSMRTIYRDLETISLAGIPIVSHAGSAGGYEIMEQYRIDRQFLSLEELQSIVAALRGVQASLDEQEIGSLLDKVGALVARSDQEGSSLGQQLVIDLNSWHRGDKEKECLSAVRQAIRDRRVLAFHYTSSGGEDTERTCEPLGVVLKGYTWYLSAYCRLRQDTRIFRLSRIDRLSVLEETFEPRPHTLQSLTYRGSRTDRPAFIRLVLQVQPRAKARVHDLFGGCPMQKQPDGTLLVTAEQPDEPWLYGMLLSFGMDVRVLEPESVAGALAAKAREIALQYEGILT